MKCWICGVREADSREHLIKASDMRLFYPGITPSTPVYMYTGKKRNIALHSAKTDKIKTDNQVICRRCNDTETAVHDYAWSGLIQYIHNNWGLLVKRKKFSLSKVFPGNSNKKSIFFQLYFVKLFGCRIIDEGIPIDVKGFSQAIRNDSPLDYFYLTFNYRSVTESYIGVSGIHAKNYSGSLEMATWYYTLGELDVQITWFKNEPLRNVPKAWSPNDRGKVIQFRKR